MAKPEWGTKRVCLNCGARFYDLGRAQIVCPSCGTPFDLESAGRAKRTRTVAARAPEAEGVAEADEEAEADVEEAEAEGAVEAEEEEEEEEGLIEDASELGDDDDMSDVIDSDSDGDERG